MKSRRKSRNLRLVKITYVRKNTRVFPNVRVYLAHRGHTISLGWSTTRPMEFLCDQTLTCSTKFLYVPFSRMNFGE